MKIQVTQVNQGEKILAIKGLRTVAKIAPVLVNGEFTDRFGLKEAKDFVDTLPQTLTVSTGRSKPMSESVLAILRAHGMTAEVVVPQVEVPLDLLKRLRDAVSPGVKQANWDLFDEVDDAMASPR